MYNTNRSADGKTFYWFKHTNNNLFVWRDTRIWKHTSQNGSSSWLASLLETKYQVVDKWTENEDVLVISTAESVFFNAKNWLFYPSSIEELEKSSSTFFDGTLPSSVKVESNAGIFYVFMNLAGKICVSDSEKLEPYFYAELDVERSHTPSWKPIGLYRFIARSRIRNAEASGGVLRLSVDVGQEVMQVNLKLFTTRVLC